MGGRFRKRVSAKLRPVAAVLFRLSAQPSEVRALGWRSEATPLVYSQAHV